MNTAHVGFEYLARGQKADIGGYKIDIKVGELKGGLFEAKDVSTQMRKSVAMIAIVTAIKLQGLALQVKL